MEEKVCHVAAGGIPKVSVIVPVYKVESCVKRCLESIATQSVESIEVLVIDDGSPDKSGKICDEFAKNDPRFRVFHKKNEGVSVARNLGLDNAKGEFIAFVDSDDWVEVDYIKDMLEAILVSSDIDLVVAAESQHVGERVFRRSVREIILTPISAICEYSIYKRGYPWGKLYKNSILNAEKIRFYREIKYSEDLVFALEYMKFAKKISIIGSHQYNYVRRPEGAAYSHFDYATEKYTFEKIKNSFENLEPSLLSDRKVLNFTKYYLFRMLFSLYRPSSFHPLRERHELLKSEKDGNFEYLKKLTAGNFLESLFLSGKLRVFDAFCRVLFALRYGLFSELWGAYIRLKNRWKGS